MVAEALLEVQELKKHFRQGRHIVKAVDGVSLRIERGQTLGLVGESGCGKSTLGRTVLRLYDPTSGKVLFNGQDIATLSGKALQSIRTKMQIIFQDPASSLNPIMTTGRNIQEAFAIHRVGTEKEQWSQVERLLDEVGIGRQFAGTFPYELSIGQQQRVAIARAVALNPDFIVCDEPVSSLDLSIQGQIIALLSRLQQEYGLTYLFISHDLRVVQFMSHHIGVMYLGRLVEVGTATVVYDTPAHPYTQSLLSAIPEIDGDDGPQRERIILKGEPPSPLNPPSGCPFHPRCSHKMDVCETAFPPTVSLSPEHRVACYLYSRT